MIRFVVAFCLFLLHHSVFATIYYSQGSVSPSVLTNWNTNPAGGGTTPASFILAGDHFIIKTGNNMTTTATWTVGGASSILEIQSGASLTGDHLIQFTGTFMINDGGTYIHNNTAAVSSVAGASIWGGSESFTLSSTVEIRKWIDIVATLPAGISWGNLTINITTSIGGSWNQAGNLATVLGNLRIIATGVGTDEFRVTATVNANLNIDGDLIIDGGIFNIKSTAGAGQTSIVQVHGSVYPNGGTLSTGICTAVGDAELRFNGDFISSGSAIITSGNDNSYLVINGTGSHVFSCAQTLNCSFREASGNIVDLAAPLTTSGVLKSFTIQGTFNQNGHTMSMSGPLEVAGGTFNGFGALNISVACRACTGNSLYNTANSTWCQTAGTKGTVNISNSIVTLDRNVSTANITAGHSTVDSPGDVYFVNSNSGTTGSTFQAGYILRPGCIFSLDGTSNIGGPGSIYLGQGGTLRIGSMDGISATSGIGNVRTTTRIYNAGGTNNFEYFGTNVQVTGDGLPASLTGTLKINNTAGTATTGVTLSQATTEHGVLDLTLGKLTTTATLITLSSTASTANESANSFVAGPMKKIGNTNFIFPIGIGQIYAPFGLLNVSDETVSDQFTAEYKRANPQLFGTTYGPGIDHISYVEYWVLSASSISPFLIKNVSLDVHATSFCFDPLGPTPSTHTFVSRFAAGGWNKDASTTVQTGVSGPNKLGTLTTTGGISSFSPFGMQYTIGTDLPTLANPLPVKLIAFNATRNNNTAAINWELATVCSKDAVFEVEKSANGRPYSMLAHIPGSETNRFYLTNDQNLDKGITYYRLKMIDENGIVTYSKVVALINDTQGILITSLAPNPVRTIANLTISLARTTTINFAVYDISGKAIKQWAANLRDGITILPVDFSGFASGLYQITASSADAKTSFRFIKQ